MTSDEVQVFNTCTLAICPDTQVIIPTAQIAEKPLFYGRDFPFLNITFSA